MNKAEVNTKIKDNKLPVGWVKIRLGELGKFKTSSVDKKVDKNEKPVRLINYMDVYRKNFIDNSLKLMEVTASNHETTVNQVRKGDILFTPSSETPDDIGHSAVILEDLPNTLYSYHLVRLSIRESISLDLKFRGYLCNFKEVLRQFEQSSTGVTRYTLSKKDFEEVEIILPISPTEQQKITEIMETVDQTIEKTDAIIEKYKRIKQGLMQDLFGNLASYGGSVEKLIKERIILEIQDGNHGEKHPKITDFIEDGIPFIMASDITENQINFNTCHHISEKQYNSLRIGFAKKNDVLLSHKASVGFTAIVPNKRIMLTPQVTYYRIANKNVLLPEYLFYYFQSKDFQKKIKDLAKQSTRDYIGIVSQRKNLEIYFPKNLEKQKEIINILSKIDLIIQKEKKYKEKFERIKQGLMEDLLTGKVRVFNVN